MTFRLEASPVNVVHAFLGEINLQTLESACAQLVRAAWSCDLPGLLLAYSIHARVQSFENKLAVAARMPARAR
jgi:hypothetical protein